ncbi:MAG: hypothetical protein ACPHV3_04840 [Vibrio sp.]
MRFLNWLIAWFGGEEQRIESKKAMDLAHASEHQFDNLSINQVEQAAERNSPVQNPSTAQFADLDEDMSQPFEDVDTISSIGIERDDDFR